MTAADILKAALGHMEDRAATYDKPEGERSMPSTVAAFNAVTGLALTAEQGWLFCVLLKAVRSQQGGYRADNYDDGAAYFALMGEQASGDRAHTGGAKIATKPAPLPGPWVRHELASAVAPVEGRDRVEVQYLDGQSSRGQARHVPWESVTQYRRLS